MKLYISNMKSLLLFLFFFIFNFISCQKEDTLDSAEIIEFKINQPAKRFDKIEILFSKKIVDKDSTQKAIYDNLFEFSPLVEGYFIWKDETKLLFIPEKPYQAGTKIIAKLNEETFFKQALVKKIDGKKQFEFEVESFYLQSIEYFYQLQNNQPTVNINLRFSYKADPIELKDKLTIFFKGEPIKNFSVIQKYPAEIISLSLTDKKLFSGGELELKFSEDFASVETKTAITRSQKYSIILSDALELRIIDYETFLSFNEGKIVFTTTQAVDIESLKGKIFVDPQTEYKITQTPTGFAIEGAFTPEIQYRVKIEKGIKGVLGGMLEKEFIQEIAFSDIEPDFYFEDEGSYLSLSGGNKITFKSVNYDKFVLEVYKIFANNIEHFFSMGSYYDWEYDYENDRYERNRYFSTQKYGFLISKDTISVNSRKNKLSTNEIDFKKYLKDDYNGIYVIRLYPSDSYWRRKEKVLSASDIGIIAKNSSNELFIFAINVNNLKPISDATVKIISQANQIIAAEKTNKAGIATINKKDLPNETDDSFAPSLVIIEKDKDFNFLRFDDSRVQTSKFDVGGKVFGKNNFDLMLTSNRDIYRPGERIYVMGILRNKDLKIEKSQSLKLYLINPFEKIISEKNVLPDNQGMFETFFDTKEDFRTGRYKIVARFVDGTYLQTLSALLEDFVPERLKVESFFSKQETLPSETPLLNIKSEYFFGQKASGRKYETSIELRSIQFLSKNYSDYSFANYYNKAQIESFDSRLYEIYNGSLNEEGEASFKLNNYSHLPSIGYLEIVARTAVFDETNRPVYSVARTKLYNNNFLIGIKTDAPYFVSPGYKISLKLVCVDYKDKLYPLKNASVKLIRNEWRSVLRNVDGKLRYVSEKFEVVEFSRTLDILQETTIEISPKAVGEYSLIVGYENNFNLLNFESYSWGAISSPLFKVNPEAQIDIVLDKEFYSPGENVKALLKLPFDGKILVSIERDKVYDYYILESKNMTAEFSFKASESHFPNVYISSILIRDVYSGNFPLKVGYGFKPVIIKDENKNLNIRLFAPEKSKPEQKIKIELSATKNSKALICGVDAGILQITKFQPQNPLQYFSQKRALEVETYNIFKSLIMEPTNSSSPGGDESLEAEMTKRVASLGVKRFKPVSFWSGIITPNSNGKAEVEFNIPEFNGELKIFALAADGEKFAFAQKSIKVSDDILISASIPRFITGGDSTVVYITLFNNTSVSQNITVFCETTPNLKLYSLPTTLQVSSNSNKTIEATLVAKNVFEEAKLIFIAKGSGSTAKNSVDILIRNKFPYAVNSENGVVINGKGYEKFFEDDFYEFNRSSRILLTTLPIENFSDRLLALARYPYGCLEQTISTAFPQLYLKNIYELLTKGDKKALKSEFHVKEAIEKTQRLQRYDGAFLMWSGDNQAYDWICVYACHFLLEAQKAGYPIDKQTSDKGLLYIRGIAKSKKQYEILRETRTGGKKIYKADKAVIYALYVLALAGMPDVSTMNFYKYEKSLLTPDTRAMLAAAYALAGDKLSFAELMQNVDSDYNQLDYFDSELRSKAIIFSMLAEIDPYNELTTAYLKTISREYAKRNYFSTQEDAFVLLGIGKLAKRSFNQKIEADIFIGDKKFIYNGNNLAIEENIFGKNIKIIPRTSGQFYFSIIKEGFPKNFSPKKESFGINAERTFLNIDGREKTNFYINDLVVVKITLSSRFDNLENIAITDWLPACLEIENPRLRDYANLTFIVDLMEPRYVDMRDDKIIIYVDLKEKTKNYYYLARVVSKGKFYLPSITAEVMYAPEIRSQSESKVLYVE